MWVQCEDEDDGVMLVNLAFVRRIHPARTATGVVVLWFSNTDGMRVIGELRDFAEAVQAVDLANP